MTTAETTFTLEFPYRRSLGPVVGGFLTGLREGSIRGIRTPSGRVLCPPLEYDPDTGAPLADLIDLTDTGTVGDWAWVEQPLRKHPLQHPFAWAMITIDGADTAILHAVDAGSVDAMRRGMRVRARWRDEREGRITDIECFAPEEG